MSILWPLEQVVKVVGRSTDHMEKEVFESDMGWKRHLPLFSAIHYSENGFTEDWSKGKKWALTKVAFHLGYAYVYSIPLTSYFLAQGTIDVTVENIGKLIPAEH